MRTNNIAQSVRLFFKYNRSRVLVFLLLLAPISLYWVGDSAAQTNVAGVKTDLGVYIEPTAPPLPSAGGKFADPTFGTEIMRVTDAGNSGPNAGTSYSYWPTFNATNTRIVVQDEGSLVGFSIYDFDPVNFILGAKQPPPPLVNGGYPIGYGTDVMWSHSNPDILYGHSGAKFYTYNCATGTYTLVFDLTSQLPAGTYFFQASMSADGDVFATTLMMSGTWAVSGYLAYRQSTNTIVYRSTDDNNEVKIDKSGRYLYVNTNQHGVGQIEGIVIDTQTGIRTNLTDDAPGYAPSHYDAGTNLIVGNANYLPGITARRMSDPTHFTNIFDTIVLPNYGAFHLSMLGDDETKVLVGFYGVHTSGIMQNELVLIETTGSQRVWRLAHHHSVYSTYSDTPRANISRDGRFLAFTSNWGVPGGRRDLFIAKIELPNSPTPTPTPTPTPASVNSSASFVQLDTTTEGNWKNVYGGEGYNTVNDSVSYPGYAQVSVTGYTSPTWTPSTTDVRALQKASASDRVAARWDSTSFLTIDLNLTDGASHQIAIYGLDWDGNNRIQRIDVLDWASNALLDSRTISSFNGGQYLVWNIQGRVKIIVNKLGGRSAVVSGLYFSSAVATPTPTPTPSPTLSTGKQLRKTKRNGQDLSNQLVSSSSTTELSSTTSVMDLSAQTALAAFVSDIQKTYDIFNTERNLYPAAARIDIALNQAIAAGGLAMQAANQGDLSGVRRSLRQAIDKLELSDVLITYGDVANPIDIASYMVRQQYVDFLDREPDQYGGDFWTNEITSCGADIQCVEVKRINVSAAFFQSIEFQQTGFYVYRLYRSSYGRAPMRSEFLPDNRSIANGLIVGETGWEIKLVQNKQAFVKAWVQRPEFQTRYASLTNEQYIDSLIANLGVTISPAERDNLVLNLVQGSSRADVLSELVDKPAVTRAESNAAFVLMQYFGYLGRDPDDAGFTFWLAKLNQFNGNFIQAEMVKAFLSSTEYRQRFGL